MQGLDVVGPVILEQELIKDRSRRIYIIKQYKQREKKLVHVSIRHMQRKWKCRVRYYARCIRNHVTQDSHAHHEQPRLTVIYSMATHYYDDGAVQLPT